LAKRGFLMVSIAKDDIMARAYVGPVEQLLIHCQAYPVPP
jgi:hypothetical protein